MEECKGCYRERVNTCTLFCRSKDTDKKPKNCPCMICLIKVICYKTCEDRSIYWNREYDRLCKDKTK